jgi:phenylacetic acid degradation protein paaN
MEEAVTTFFDGHRALLERAVQAAATRTYWSPYPEVPSGKIYGETAKADGEAAFKAQLGRPFDLDQPGNGRHVGGRQIGKEESPWGLALGITYPAAEVGQLIDASRAAGTKWGEASIEARVGVCLEVLHRLNKQSFLMAHAVQHTSGQAFVMAFQAGGPHAQDRGLEAVAYAWTEMTRVPATARWEKAQGSGQDPLRLDKRWRIVPRGVAVAVGCSTFPTWNSYPGLFASLATGNTVIVKPHPGAILPLAITVKIGRSVLAEAGFDPNVLLLAADEPEAQITKELATHPAVAIIDYTGSPQFGRWLREHARQAQVFTEEAGINPVVVDSTSSFKGMCGNIAFSLSLYSGQMCTAPQNVFVPRSGIGTDEGHKSFAEVAQGIADAVQRLSANPERAAAVFGTIQSPATLARVREIAAKGRALLQSGAFEVPGMPGARTATPLILTADAGDASDAALFGAEQFGPISFVVGTASTEESIAKAAGLAREKGAITASVYSTNTAVLDQTAQAFAAAGVSLSCNLTGGIYVNQSAAFSDYHVSGANPAGNATLTDSAFVASRFRVAGIRAPATA